MEKGMLTSSVMLNLFQHLLDAGFEYSSLNSQILKRVQNEVNPNS